MKLTGLAISMGLGVAAGAVAVMMLPKQSAARKLVNKAACKVEDAAWKVSDKMHQAIDM
ncbi:MAG: hypothetical protein IJW94_03545 [Oscillospiraceae bacterium]|nr:hypothetical protein [Oscillospiraceae bacterium]